jgi:hypothetical protein
MIIPKTSTSSDEWRTLTFNELATAVDGTARWIENTLGVNTGERETVAYLG